MILYGVQQRKNVATITTVIFSVRILALPKVPMLDLRISSPVVKKDKMKSIKKLICDQRRKLVRYFKKPRQYKVLCKGACTTEINLRFISFHFQVCPVAY